VGVTGWPYIKKSNTDWGGEEKNVTNLKVRKDAGWRNRISHRPLPKVNNHKQAIQKDRGKGK